MSLVFSFGIITDTHIRAPSGDLSSPYQVNELANERARYAIALLAAQQPEFVVHLGDMVHPIPSMQVYDAACETAKTIFKHLDAPLHYVPGNHDIGDKPVAGAPAEIVSEDSIATYQAQFGPSWKCFTHKNYSIVIINSSLINTGLQQEKEQFIWLQNCLEQNKQRRTIVFSHYPLFVHDIDEAEHYDNIANPGRQKLLQLFTQYEVELVFSGHVHQFFYNREGGSSYYVLPATSFTRQDYSELFSVEPMPEFGRDDTGKYAVAMVHVFDHGHELQLIPTEGKLDNTSSTTPPALPKHPRVPEKALSVSLRHAWHASEYLPYNGPMEEFSRKRARNDYGLLRLLQMGIRHVRVPLQDITHDESRERVQAYYALGIRFHVFCLAEEWPSALNALDKWGSFIESLECVFSGQPANWNTGQMAWPETTPVCISYASSGAHHTDSGKPFAHSVSTGFQWPDNEWVLKALSTEFENQPINGVLFQIPWEADLDTTITEIKSVFSESQWHCKLYLRLASSNPALANFDDDLIEKRVISAMELVKGDNKLELCLDTFMDMDRGYSPRHGLIDRHCNFRLTGKTLHMLNDDGKVPA